MALIRMTLKSTDNSICENQFLENLCIGTQCGGVLILADFRPIYFHAGIVFGLGKNLLFKSDVGHCEKKERKKKERRTIKKPDSQIDAFKGL